MRCFRTGCKRHLASLITSLILSASWVGPSARADSDQVRIEGLTEPYRQAELAAGEPGILDRVLVKEGDTVAAGQVLAQLDTTVLECTLAIAQQRAASTGALQAAEAEVELRRTYFEQLSQLRDRGHSTQREMERAETDLRVAEARVLMAREELELQTLECRRIEAQIDRRQIHAPFAGVVSAVAREVGEPFLSSEPSVVTLVQLDQLRARFPVAPQLLADVTVGKPFQIEMTESRQRVEAVVESIAPVIDAKSSTVTVTFVIANESRALASGARCTLLIPQSASSTDTETNFTSTTSGSASSPEGKAKPKKKKK